MPERKTRELVSLLSQGGLEEISARLTGEHPADIAAALQEIEPPLAGCVATF